MESEAEGQLPARPSMSKSGPSPDLTGQRGQPTLLVGMTKE